MRSSSYETSDEDHRQALDMSRAGSITLPDRPGRNLKRPLAAIAIQKRRGKTRDSFLADALAPRYGSKLICLLFFLSI